MLFSSMTKRALSTFFFDVSAVLQLSPCLRYVDTSNSQNVQKSPGAAALATAQVENTPLKIKKIINLIPVLKLKKV